MDAPNNQGQQKGPPAPAPGSQPQLQVVPPAGATMVFLQQANAQQPQASSAGATTMFPPQMVAMQGMPAAMNVLQARQQQLTPQQAALMQQQIQLMHRNFQQASGGTALNTSMSQPLGTTHGASGGVPLAAARSPGAPAAVQVQHTVESLNLAIDQYMAHLPNASTPEIPPGQQTFTWQLAPSGATASVPREFFEKYQGLWKAFSSKNSQVSHHLSLAYTLWKQRDGSISTAAAAGGAVRPPTHAAQRPPVKPRAQQSDVQERGKASAAELQKKREAQRQEGAAALAGAFPSIVAPRNGEDQAFLPLPRLRSLVRETCGPTAKLTAEGEGAMKALADDFVSGAIGFAVDMAKRKKARKLDPADLALYFKRTWNIDVPGLNQGQVTQYRRITPSEAHRARLAAVRKANMATAAAGGGGGGSGRVPGRAGAATPAQSPAAGGSVGVTVSPTTAAVTAPAAAVEGKGKAPMREPEQVADGGGGDEDMPDVF